MTCLADAGRETIKTATERSTSARAHLNTHTHTHTHTHRQIPVAPRAGSRTICSSPISSGLRLLNCTVIRSDQTETQRHTEAHRGRHTEADTQRQTHRSRHTEAHRGTQRHTEADTQRQAHRSRHTEAHTEKERQRETRTAPGLSRRCAALYVWRAASVQREWI